MSLVRAVRTRWASEGGQVVVFIALLIPVFFGIGAIVIDVGNWFVHKRHLQTQVDAAALAAAPKFTGCFFAPDGANAAIAQEALQYAGDTTRDPATTNLQVQEPNDVHVVLNSNVYWTGDPYPPDNTYDTDGDGAGDPCNESALDVKATDDDAPRLWGLLPLSASPKAKARVEIRRTLDQVGILPLAVPEVDPQAVAAIFVDEEDGSVISALELIEGPCPDSSYPFVCWAVDFPSVEINVDRIGVVILLSRNDRDPDLTGTLSEICGQDPGFVICYAGGGNQDGLGFIHGWDGRPGQLQSPVLRDVELFDVNCAAGGDYSSPYFLVNGECTVGIRATLDFGMDLGPNPAAFPKCVHVISNVAGELAFETDTPDGTVFTGSFGLAESSGPNTINITWESRNPSRNNCNQRRSGTFSNVGRPYVADESSGPVEYLTLMRLSAPFGFANSTEKDPNPRPIRVTVGLQRPLQLLDAREPPILLRLGSNPGSQTQALDCDAGTVVGPAGPHANFRNEFVDGCMTWYSVNYADWSDPPDDTEEWIDIDCSEHPFGNQPPPQTVNDPFPNCIAIQTGVTAGQFEQALRARFASPCTPNNWPDDDATDEEVDAFFRDYDFLNDPRYVTLVIADFTAFQGQGSSEPRPIKAFGGFYYTGSGAVQCPDDDRHPRGVTGQRARFDMWGHYVNIVQFSAAGNPSDELCDFSSPELGNCVAVLVE